jgi:hypothetical protein
MLHPPQDRRVGQLDVPLGHHGHQIARTEFETQVPAHAQHYDLLVEMATLEQFLQRSKSLLVGCAVIQTVEAPPGIAPSVARSKAASQCR